MRSKRWKIHAIAVCTDCSFEEGDYKMAVEKARLHAEQTGHEVTVETGFAMIYNERKLRRL